MECSLVRTLQYKYNLTSRALVEKKYGKPIHVIKENGKVITFISPEQVGSLQKEFLTKKV